MTDIIKAIQEHLRSWPHLRVPGWLAAIIDYDYLNGTKLLTCPYTDDRYMHVGTITIAKGNQLVLRTFHVIGTTDDPDYRQIVGLKGEYKYDLCSPKSLDRCFTKFYRHLKSLGYPCERPKFDA